MRFKNTLNIFTASLLTVAISSQNLALAAQEGGRAAPTDKASKVCIDLMTRAKTEDKQVELSADGLRVKSFKPHVIQKLMAERAKLIQAYSVLNHTVLASQNYNFGIMASQIAGYHTFIYGGPGAGKTLMPQTLNPDIWTKLITEQTQRIELFGGQTLKGAEEGREEINYLNTLITAKIANIDEVDKALPQLLADLLSILNTGERRITVNGQPILVATRSVHFTSNLNIYQMIERFISNGMDGTGLAFLNRIQIKMRVPNWLDNHLLDQLLAQKDEIDRLKTLTDISPQAAEAIKKLKAPNDIDWAFLEWASENMFVISEDARTVYRELINGYADDVKSKLKMMSEGQDDENRYAPTAEMTTRLAVEVPKMVRTTAFLDLMLSDLNDDEVSKVVKEPTELSPLSVWRSFWMLTSVGPGQTIFNPRTQSVDFSLVPGADGRLAPMSADYIARIARDNLELQEVSQTTDEQNKWASRLDSLLKTYLEANKSAALLLPPDDELDDEAFGKLDFELEIYRHRRKP